MRELTLFIDGRPVDLPAATKGLVRLTQARAALADLDSRMGEYTWPLTLPATRTNARVFGVAALHPLGLDKFAAVDHAYELRCESEVLTGTFRLTSLRGGYSGQLLGAGFSWALLLGEKKLTDLTFAPVAYDGTQLAATLGLGCDETDVQFPLLSFGNFYAPPLRQQQADGSYQDVPNPAGAVLDYPLSVDDYPPGVYLRNVLRQIFKEIGWSLSGRVLDEAQWRQTVLTCAGADVDKAWPWGGLLPASGAGSSATPGHSQFSYFDAGPGGGYANTAVGFDDTGTAGNFSGYDLGGEVAFLPVPVPAGTSGGTRALDSATATYIAPRAGTYAFAYTAELASGHQRIVNGNPLPNPLSSPTSEMRDCFASVLLGVLVRRGGESFSGGMLGKAGVDPTVLPAFNQVKEAFDGSGNIAGSRFYNGAASVFLEAGDSAQLCLIVRRRLRDLPQDCDVLIRKEFVVNFGAVSFACTAYADNDGVSQTRMQPSAFLPPLAQKELVRDFLKKTDTIPVADPARRIVHLLSRAEQATAAGPLLDLSQLVDPDLVEYAPTCGAGVGALVFNGPATEDPLLKPDFDTVRIAIGPGSAEQVVTGLFAPVAIRNYRLSSGTLAPIPTITDQSGLDTARSETAWDIKSQAPRLVRYTGPHATLTIPFGAGTLPLATAAWDGALAWGGIAGAVHTYYAGTVQRALRGHLARVPANLTPALYRQLRPGRRVALLGGIYTLDAVSSFDLADEANQTSIELLREI